MNADSSGVVADKLAQKSELGVKCAPKGGVGRGEDWHILVRGVHRSIPEKLL